MCFGVAEDRHVWPVERSDELGCADPLRSGWRDAADDQMNFIQLLSDDLVAQEGRESRPLACLIQSVPPASATTHVAGISAAGGPVVQTRAFRARSAAFQALQIAALATHASEIRATLVCVSRYLGFPSPLNENRSAPNHAGAIPGHCADRARLRRLKGRGAADGKMTASERELTKRASATV
jgi:hypothetical protein